MLVNISNTPHKLWPKSQLSNAQTFGGVMDYSFPVMRSDCEDSIRDRSIQIIQELRSSYDAKYFFVDDIHNSPIGFHLVQTIIARCLTVVAPTTHPIEMIMNSGNVILVPMFARFITY